MTIISRLELDHPPFLAPGTTALHAQIEGLYEALGDHIDTRYFTVEALADTATATLHHNFKSPFSSIFIKVWGWNSGTGALTEVDPADFVVAANGGNPTTDIDVQNVSGGPLDIAVTIFGSNQRLDELLNVDISGISTGQVLEYNTGTKLWTPVTVVTSIAALTDTTITAPAEGHILFYDNGSSKWINTLHTMEKITNTNISGIAEGHILHWDNGTSKWINALNSVENLTDTTVSAPAEGHVLHWDNGTSKWINALNSLENLTDTNIFALAEGHILHWNQGSLRWIAATNSVTNLTDTVISGVADGQVLTWNNGTSKWINSDPSGGQVLYDYILDAAGNGDFTDFSTAIAALTTGQTLYIRNGSYTESAYVPFTVPGIKLIGESKNGVIFTTTATSWAAFRFSHGSHRCSTERDTPNTTWSATGGLGTLSVVLDSADVTYSGTGTDPVADDLIFIEPSFYARIVSVDTGLSVITMDRNWVGDTASGLDGSVIDFLAGFDLEARTEIKNMTIIVNSGVSQVSAIRNVDGMYNTHLDNIDIEFIGNPPAGAYAFQIANTYRSSFKNISIYGNGGGTGLGGILAFNGHADCVWQNISMEGLTPNNGLVLNGNTRTIKHSKFNFSNLLGDGNITQSPKGIYKCHVEIERSSGGRVFPSGGGGNNSFYGCRVKLGRLKINTVNPVVLSGAKSVFSVDYILGNLEVGNRANTDIVVLTDSFIEGTLDVDSEVVISGSVAYDALSGAPAQNNGYLF